MKQVRLGIIGLGNMGASHLRNYMEGKMPEITVTALAERKIDRMAAAMELLAADESTAATAAQVAQFSEGEDLVASDTCDAILIAVPHYQHPSLAMLGFACDKHVMCEKPAGVYTLQVREMNSAAAKSDKVFGMMFQQRTNCVYRKMKELVEGGALGDIKRVNWIVTDWYRTDIYYASGAWRATWAGEGGGVLLNQCPHNLDLMQWICGMPSKVQAHCHIGKWHDIEVEDDVTCYLEYPNGATGVFVTTTGDTPGTNRFEITGTLGKLVCEDDILTFWKLSESERDYCAKATDGFAKPDCEKSIVETDGENPQHPAILNAFAAAILRGEPLVAGGEEGINGLMLSNAMHLSSWVNQAVEFPIDEELFYQELKKRQATSRHKEEVDIVFNTEGSY